MYKVLFSKVALKDIEKGRGTSINTKLKAFVDILKEDPYMNPPSNEKLVGDLSGLYSRGLNVKHRLVYEVDEKNKIVRVLSCWTHYN